MGENPDIRIPHYHDIEHIDEYSSEPVGGLTRFVIMVREYQDAKEEPKPVTLFPGDVFSLSLESCATTGNLVVPQQRGREY